MGTPATATPPAAVPSYTAAPPTASTATSSPDVPTHAPPAAPFLESREAVASRITNLLKPFGHEGSRRDENVLKFMNQLPSLANTDPIRFALCCREDASPRARLGGFATQIHGLRGVAVSSGGVALELTARS